MQSDLEKYLGARQKVSLSSPIDKDMVISEVLDYFIWIGFNEIWMVNKWINMYVLCVDMFTILRRETRVQVSLQEPLLKTCPMTGFAQSVVSERINLRK